jgi:hypothetical protein
MDSISQPSEKDGETIQASNLDEGHRSEHTSKAELSVERAKAFEAALKGINLGSSLLEENPIRHSEYENSVGSGHVVGWDGPNDLNDPMNWSRTWRHGHVALVSAMTFITYVHAPAAPNSRSFDRTGNLVGS